MTLDWLLTYLEDPRLAWWLLAGVTGLFLGWRLLVHARRWLRARRRQRRLDRAVAGEDRAVALLAARGWEVLDSQLQREWTLLMDGEPVAITVRADHIVRKGARRMVAEVKTGAEAPSLHYAATRRQLLEYRVAFDVDGVLLVDAERDTVHHVDFGLSA